MIRVTVELVPYGFEESKRVLGQLLISNNLTRTKESGNYNVRMLNAEGTLTKEATIEGFPRQRLGAYYLLLRALKELLGEEEL